MTAKSSVLFAAFDFSVGEDGDLVVVPDLTYADGVDVSLKERAKIEADLSRDVRSRISKEYLPKNPGDLLSISISPPFSTFSGVYRTAGSFKYTKVMGSLKGSSLIFSKSIARGLLDHVRNDREFYLRVEVEADGEGGRCIFSTVDKDVDELKKVLDCSQVNDAAALFFGVARRLAEEVVQSIPREVQPSPYSDDFLEINVSLSTGEFTGTLTNSEGKVRFGGSNPITETVFDL